MNIQTWLLGGGLGLIGACLGILIRISYKIGGDSKEIAMGLGRIQKMEIALEKIPLHEQRLGALENMYSTIRSDIKDLLRNQRGSRPDPGELR